MTVSAFCSPLMNCDPGPKFMILFFGLILVVFLLGLVYMAWSFAMRRTVVVHSHDEVNNLIEVTWYKQPLKIPFHYGSFLTGWRCYNQYSNYFKVPDYVYEAIAKYVEQKTVARQKIEGAKYLERLRKEQK